MHSTIPPVGNTCPDIDRAIKSLKRAMDAIQGVADDLDAIRVNLTEEEEDKYSDSLYTLIRALEDAKYDIDISGDLELLREANSSLRDWGYDLAKQLEEY